MRSGVSEILKQSRQGAIFDITEEHLLDLPEPVHRYLLSVGIVGKRNIRTVRLKQKGFLRRGQRWLPFTAEQCFGTTPRGFVWQARVKVLPLLSISVTDMFADGHGTLQAKLLSLVKVAEAIGSEADQGELLRYLGEIAWFPTAWLGPYIE